MAPGTLKAFAIVASVSPGRTACRPSAAATAVGPAGMLAGSLGAASGCAGGMLGSAGAGRASRMRRSSSRTGYSRSDWRDGESSCTSRLTNGSSIGSVEVTVTTGRPFCPRPMPARSAPRIAGGSRPARQNSSGVPSRATSDRVSFARTSTMSISARSASPTPDRTVSRPSSAAVAAKGAMSARASPIAASRAMDASFVGSCRPARGGRASMPLA